MDDRITLEATAKTAFQRRRYDLAAGLYRRLVDCEPSEPRHRLKLGDALLRLGCRVSAAVAYAEAARLFHGLGDHACAAAACRAALAIQPTDVGPRELLASLS